MKRIQRSRKKGWKTPENAVYVGRPTRYGNPFKLTDYDRNTAIAKYQDYLDSKLKEDTHFLDDLRGKDLVCWCGPDEKCHADVIIRKLEGKSAGRRSAQ